jgi:hypothetical protein
MYDRWSIQSSCLTGTGSIGSPFSRKSSDTTPLEDWRTCTLSLCSASSLHDSPTCTARTYAAPLSAIDATMYWTRSPRSSWPPYRLGRVIQSGGSPVESVTGSWLMVEAMSRTDAYTAGSVMGSRE